MKKLILLLSFLFAVGHNSAAEPDLEELWERALVTVEITRREFDYLQPWSRRVDQVQKLGAIIGKDEILTTADFLSNHTLVRLQKGRGRWFRGEVKWIDYHANLAILSSEDKDFWNDTKTVELAKETPRRGTAQLLRWRTGILEARTVDISRLVVKKGKLTFMDQLQLELDSDMGGVGWGEAIVRDNKIIALATSKDGNTITSLPSSFIRTCLNDRKDGEYQGLGYFPFVWQTSENPDTLEFLGQEGEPRGVIVVQVETNRFTSPLKPRDIILEIDGFKIDVQGDYKDPVYGNLLLENLATREKRAGDKVEILISRDGEEQKVNYTLPRVEYGIQLVPLAVNDQEPEYFIMGGLVFQPLTVPYLLSWGADWSRKAPFRLGYATREDATKDKPSYVILSLVLPDPFNLGYQETRYLILEKLNGREVSTLGDLIAAKETPRDGYHLFEFKEGDSLRRIVLDAAEVDNATARVLERYGIESDRSIVQPAPSTSRKLARD